MQMHNNRYWLAFLIVLGLCVTGYTTYTLYYLFQYVILSQQAPVQDIRWSYKEVHSEEYVLHADYRLQLPTQVVDGGSDLPSQRLLNPWAAEQAIKKMQTRSWKAWYNPRNPHNSALQKYFPTKECISALVLWALLLYFVFLGFYVTKYGRDHSKIKNG